VSGTPLLRYISRLYYMQNLASFPTCMQRGVVTGNAAKASKCAPLCPARGGALWRRFAGCTAAPGPKWGGPVAAMEIPSPHPRSPKDNDSTKLRATCPYIVRRYVAAPPGLRR
jgi:hypothetical protein